jgi:acetyl-CoA carboxylase biotin carboxyl carrier protein
LIVLVSVSNVSELEITEAEGKVRIVKGGTGGVQHFAQPQMQMVAPAGMAQPLAGSAAAPAAAASAPAAAPETTGFVVKSPMVGTFYRSSSPGAKPFVEVGAQVKEGDTVCIIEAMKILNEIEGGKAGTISKVLCENGQAVEYGQPLFIIE